MSSAVALSSFGPVEAGTLLWTQGGALRVTLVLRTAFGLAPGPLTQSPPGAVERVEAHYKSDPARAVRTPNDLAPRLPRAEVVHAGAVIAPAGITMVRLAVLREGKALFDKRAVASAKNDSSGLGPVGPSAPERQALLRGHPEPRPDADGVLTIEDGFDFSFYQAAPADQQLDALLGGDQILIGNLHPELAELAVLVPSRAPVARAMLGRQEAPLPLACRRVIVDTDRRTYTLVWYGELELPGIEAVRHLRIEARAPELAASRDADGPKADGPRMDVQQLIGRIAAGAPRAPSTPDIPVRVTGTGTVVMDPVDVPVAARQPAPVGPVGPVAPIAPVAPARPSFAATTIVEDGPVPAATLPFATSASAPLLTRAARDLSATPWAPSGLKPAPKPAHPLAGTLGVDENPAVPMVRRPPPEAPPPPIEVQMEAPVEAPMQVEPPAPAPIRADGPAAATESPWAPPEEAPPVRPQAQKAPPPPPRPKGPAAASATLKKDSNDRFRKR